MNTEKIEERAASIKLVRVLLTVIAALFFSIGWLTRVIFSVVRLSIVWSLAAAAEGWDQRKGDE